ncbi:MAG: 50S ribosomal protein L23 [Verrucomicrobia bacterium]|nr:50S ribosomal protein L23 [Verrucomicrobiota bacterium]
MRQPTEVIFRPRISEKGTRLASAHNQYLFDVAPDATKLEIRQAVTALFGKKVVRVNTMRRQGKARRSRRGEPGRTNHSKRAIVTLAEGQKIEIA